VSTSCAPAGIGTRELIDVAQALRHVPSHARDRSATEVGPAQQRMVMLARNRFEAWIFGLCLAAFAVACS
jgi:hypothetical protein